MFSFAGELSQFLESNIEKYTDALQLGVERAGKKDYNREGFKQAILGFVSILKEALNEEGTAKRTIFLEAIIPSLVANGEDLRGVMAPSTSVGMIVLTDVVRNFPTTNPDALAGWLIEWMSTFLGDVCNAAAQAAVEVKSLRLSGEKPQS